LRRLLVALSATLIAPATIAVGVGIASTSASAAAKPTIVTCKSLTGAFTSTGSTGSITGCNTKSVTGGSGSLAGTSTSSTSGTSTITWKSKETTIGTYTTTTVTPSKCPSTYPTEVDVAATVTGGTATALVGGKAKDTLCVNDTTGKYELLPKTKYKI
jgi:hypothetical protein